MRGTNALYGPARLSNCTGLGLIFQPVLYRPTAKMSQLNASKPSKLTGCVKTACKNVTSTPCPEVPVRHPIRPLESLSCKTPLSISSSTQSSKGKKSEKRLEFHTSISPHNTTSAQRYLPSKASMLNAALKLGTTSPALMKYALPSNPDLYVEGTEMETRFPFEISHSQKLWNKREMKMDSR